MSLDAPYGSWPSPISARHVVAGGTKVTDVKAFGGHVWWLETRPWEKGRSVVVSAPIDAPGRRRDRMPAGWSSRSRVNEYGGGSWWLGSGRLYFVSADDQRIHVVQFGPEDTEATAEGPGSATVGTVSDPNGSVSEPRPITPEPAQANGWCYADGQEHPVATVMVCVREDHHPDGEPANEIVAVPVDGGEPAVLVAGADFYQCPRVSPDGRWLSWVEWDHPHMPWQETTLKVAPLFGDGSERRPLRVGNVQPVTTGFGVHGAAWTTDGRLVYSSDRSGYWNLYWWTAATGGQLTDLADAEIGYPPWIFGIQPWTDLGDGRLAAIVTRDAVDSAVVVAQDGSLQPIVGPASDGGRDDRFGPSTTVAIESISALADSDHPAIAVIASTPTRLAEIIVVAADGRESTDVQHDVITVRPADTVDVDPAWFSTPRSIWFESDGRSTQLFLYLPAGLDGGFRSDRPPLIVMGHGGPTAHSGPALSLKIQYWTSRGFAVADVNYGGSTGFGREYRDRIHEGWGVVDVDDCVNAARHLAESGVVDGDRMAIRGSSSGGLTVMSALIRSDCFAAGVSLYGVTDLAALAADTHKFESHYIDWLVGPYPAEAGRYRDRSPATHVDRLDTPMLLMQGTEDKVVPPSQAETVVAALRSKGLPHLYVTFEGEGHGLRQAESLITSLEVELWFYGRVFGFEPGDHVT
ncbi:MAG: prolyl oligopeptidase family serine peptidase, partial [Acidimicrobiia bacterium]|nr:prolyl oligopeptidase family serine peptidase [Acidimicrobiia bacterium]